MQLRGKRWAWSSFVAAALAAVLVPSVAAVGALMLTPKAPITFGSAPPVVTLPPAGGGMLTLLFPPSPGGISGANIRFRYKLTAPSTGVNVVPTPSGLPGEVFTINIKRKKITIKVRNHGPHAGSPFKFTIAAV
jgi:hypothetical protein